MAFQLDEGEERSNRDLWAQFASTVPRSCLSVQEVGNEKIEVNGIEHWLADHATLTNLLRGCDLVLDISSLSHRAWAPLLKAGLEGARSVRALYTEPRTYRSNPEPTSEGEFDLSEGFDGVEAIPGFLHLGLDEDEWVYVPLLGFEGNRPSHIASTIEPVPLTIPVVGLPAFRPEYPQVTILRNRDFLDQHRAYQNLRFARASCPFALLGVIQDIRHDFPDFHLRVAPIGTKPHALGAILAAIEAPQDVEIVYDHPRRKPGRTMGVGPTHVYTLKTDFSPCYAVSQ